MDWILSGLVLVGNFTIGKKLKWGWMILSINSLGWVIYAIWILDPPQWGLVPSAIINFFICSANVWKWFREEE